MSFIATQNKGFRMKFDNGFSISVQWGTMNYCEKKNLMAEYKDEMKEPIWESKSAEIAVFNEEGIVPIGGDDQVIGWLTPNEVAKIIAIVAAAINAKEFEGEIQRKIKDLRI